MRKEFLMATVIAGMLLIAQLNQPKQHWYNMKPQAETYVVELSQPTEAKEEVVETLVLDESIPEEVQLAAIKYGEEYGISPEFLEAVAYYESRYVADVDSKDGSCKGLMQIAPKWHKDRMKKLGVEDLHDIDQNMHVAADYLCELFYENDDPGIVLMKYNGDQRWKQGKISKYAKKILELTKELEERHEGLRNEVSGN